MRGDFDAGGPYNKVTCDLGERERGVALTRSKRGTAILVQSEGKG